MPSLDRAPACGAGGPGFKSRRARSSKYSAWGRFELSGQWLGIGEALRPSIIANTMLGNDGEDQRGNLNDASREYSYAGKSSLLRISF